MVEKYNEDQIFKITRVPQTSYGFLKRLSFIYSIISQNMIEKRNYNVLDVGCGTGEYLTIPLGSLIENIEILGIDTDKKSIEYAKTKKIHHNIEFQHISINKLDKRYKYDFIILSEVLEHLDDPKAMLINIRELLAPDGVLLITIPNGFGPFEIESKIFRFLKEKKIISKFGRIINRFKYKSTGKKPLESASLCEDQHIQFFTYKGFEELCLKCDLEIKCTVNRTIFAGAFSDRIIDKSNALINLNAEISDYLPHFIVSDWMFAVKKSS